jgi:tripartite-type tricarboxylate transporter receptor subunit TctC
MQSQLIAQPKDTSSAMSALPIQIVVPFPPGGIDLILHLLLPELAKRLGQPVHLVNHPGGTGAHGSLEVANAKPNGLTLLFASQGPLVYQPQINTVGYDALHSFVPVCRVTSTPSVLMASGSSAFNSVADVVAAAEAAPGRIAYSSPGTGGLPHIGMAAFAKVMGLDLQHKPMAGAAAAIKALKDGQAELIAEQLPTAIALASEGARIIGVFAPHRLSTLPHVPTMMEQGCDLSFQSWNALMAPANTPTATLKRLSDACLAAMVEATPELNQKMGVDPAYLGSAQTATFIASELDRACELTRRSGLIHQK